MCIGWLTRISAALLPHSLCRFTTANAPANRQMPIASVVSGKFKKHENATKKTWLNWLKRKQLTDYEKYIRQQDWYYQHSWFEKGYFTQKLKRKFMNTVFKFSKKILDKVFDSACDKFFIQFKFGIEKGVYVDLPLIIYADGIEDAQNVVGEINSFLNTLKFKVIEIPKLTKISNDYATELEKQILSKYTKDDIIGEMELFTMRRKDVKFKYLQNVPEIDESLNGYSSKDKQIINFKVITSNSKTKSLFQNEKYNIFIKLSKDEPIEPPTFEEMKSRIKEIMGFKPE